MENIGYEYIKSALRNQMLFDYIKESSPFVMYREIGFKIEDEFRPKVDYIDFSQIITFWEFQELIGIITVNEIFDLIPEEKTKAIDCYVNSLSDDELIIVWEEFIFMNKSNFSKIVNYNLTEQLKNTIELKRIRRQNEKFK